MFWRQNILYTTLEDNSWNYKGVDKSVTKLNIQLNLLLLFHVFLFLEGGQIVNFHFYIGSGYDSFVSL